MKNEKNIYISCDLLRPSFIERQLLRYGWMEKEKTFILRPCRLTTSIELAKQFKALGIDLIAPQLPPEALIPIVEMQRHLVTKIIAMAIKNNIHKSSGSIRRFLSNNMDNVDLAKILYLVQKTIGTAEIIHAVYELRTLGLTNPANQTAQIL